MHTAQILAALVLMTITMATRAKSGLEIEQTPPALACLTPAAKDRGQPVYPEDELKMKDAATVRVQLTFTAADRAPRVKVIKNTGRRAFEGAVEEFVSTYRLPCLLEADAPVIVTQEFHFNPGDGRKVVFGDVGNNLPPDIASCFSTPKDTLVYPKESLQRGEGGTVIAEIIFKQQDQEPEVKILYNAHSPRLASAVRANAIGYRLTCPLPDDQPIKATQTFNFEISGNSRYAFKDAELVQVLKSVDPKEIAGVKFNFQEMGCPFDLSVKFRQPYVPNVVGEYGRADPRRKEFIDWMKKIKMTIPRQAEPYVIDKAMKLSVPCAVLDLTAASSAESK